MVRSFSSVLIVVLGLALPLAFAGEIVGTAYISEKDGVIEVPAEGWSIEDTEKKPPYPNHIAKFKVKNALRGMTPHVDLFRLANPGGAVLPEAMLAEISKGLAATPGFSVKPIEERQMDGRRVHVLSVTMVSGNARVNGLVYMLKGDRSLYWAQFFANTTIWDEVQPMFNKLVESAKY